MGKGKLQKFAEMATNPLVVNCPYDHALQPGMFALYGHWGEVFFHNDHPIILELGCGRGEYTIGLARRFPQTNFIGVDIKGARMWHGATEALHEGLNNAGFLRTRVELLDRLFAPSEVSELWLTFSDPQVKKPRKRLTHPLFLERYRRFLQDGGRIHLKTDSKFLFTYTRLVCERNQLPVEASEEDLYAATGAEAWLTEIQTYYERMWREQGLPIRYLRFRLPSSGTLRASERNQTRLDCRAGAVSPKATLEEPDEEIPVDGYRSYGHEVRSTKLTRK